MTQSGAKVKAVFIPFCLGGKIIFACKPATFWAISLGTSQMVPAVYFTKITGKNKAVGRWCDLVMLHWFKPTEQAWIPMKKGNVINKWRLKGQNYFLLLNLRPFEWFFLFPLCLDTKWSKGQGCIYSFLLEGKIIFACKPATFWAISCGTSHKVPAVYFTKITG